ncbi:hypothetical protein AB1A81_15440 [Bdellovibrio bacteriovorus]|nr:hypothetical protein [Bdellovibrio bacteriovorus]
MKFILSILLALPVSAFAHEHDHDHGNTILNQSPVTLASVAALELFETGNIGKLVGFQTFKADDEAAVKLTYMDNSGTARVVGYDCHLHAHGDAQEAHCHDSADLGVIDTPANDVSFGVDEFTASLTYSADIFSRKIAPLSQITNVKMWQTGGNIWATLTHDAGAGEVKSHFMCHVHGDHFDCHRSRNPGPNEPRYQE